MYLKSHIEKLILRENLDKIACFDAFSEILSENSNPLQAAAFLSLLRAKSETIEELTAIIQFFQEKMISIKNIPVCLDIVGTGGDRTNSVNISTGSAILAASCGVKVIKHGNRAASSQTGSADVLEALGFNIHLSVSKIEESVEKFGFGFCYSPNFHLNLMKLKRLRKELNIPTTLNLLGPLLNPAKPQYFLLGVFDPNLIPTLSTVLQKNNTICSLVFHGSGLDEISTAGIIHGLKITPQKIEPFSLNPRDFGFKICDISSLKGGDAKMNAQLLLNAFNGEKNPLSDTLILNAAVALHIYGLHSKLETAIEHAQESLFNGLALNFLAKLKEFSNA